MNYCIFYLILALDDVPIGKDEKSNKLIKNLEISKNFHLNQNLILKLVKNNQIDFDTSIKLSGSRFVILKNNFALLERALINFMLDIHTLNLIILKFLHL